MFYIQPALIFLLVSGLSAQTPAAPDNRDLGRIALRALSSALSDHDPEVRAKAAAAWGEMGNPTAKTLLKRALKDDNAMVRVEAAYALHRLGSDEALADIKAWVEPSAGADKALSPAQELKWFARNESRIRAIERLSEIGGEDVVALFEKTLRDPSGAVRDATSIALAKMGLEGFAEQFVDAAKDPDEATRAAALRALGEIGKSDWLDAIERSASDPGVSAREEAMRALGRFSSTDTTRLLARGAKDKDARVRLRALESLAHSTDPSVLPLLQEIAKTQTDMQTQLLCQQGLWRRGQAGDFQTVSAALARKDNDLKMLALEVLGAASTDAANAKLREVLALEHDGKIRVRAAELVIKRLGAKKERP
jgi:HEAT repeat protein